MFTDKNFVQGPMAEHRCQLSVSWHKFGQLFFMLYFSFFYVFLHFSLIFSAFLAYNCRFTYRWSPGKAHISPLTIPPHPLLIQALGPPQGGGEGDWGAHEHQSQGERERERKRKSQLKLFSEKWSHLTKISHEKSLPNV